MVEAIKQNFPQREIADAMEEIIEFIRRHARRATAINSN
jgi:hypothetical protein